VPDINSTVTSIMTTIPKQIKHKKSFAAVCNAHIVFILRCHRLVPTGVCERDSSTELYPRPYRCFLILTNYSRALFNSLCPIVYRRATYECCIPTGSVVEPKLFSPDPVPIFGSCGSGSTTLPNVALPRHRYGTR